MAKPKKYDNRDYYKCKWCNETIHQNILGQWEHSKDGMANCNGGCSGHKAGPK